MSKKAQKAVCGLVSVILGLGALTACGSGSGAPPKPEKTLSNYDACEQRLRRDFIKAMNDPDFQPDPNHTPEQCVAVSDADVTKIVTDLMNEMLYTETV